MGDEALPLPGLGMGGKDPTVVLRSHLTGVLASTSFTCRRCPLLWASPILFPCLRLLPRQASQRAQPQLQPPRSAGLPLHQPQLQQQRPVKQQHRSMLRWTCKVGLRASAEGRYSHESGQLGTWCEVWRNALGASVNRKGTQGTGQSKPSCSPCILRAGANTTAPAPQAMTAQPTAADSTAAKTTASNGAQGQGSPQKGDVEQGGKEGQEEAKGSRFSCGR